MHNQALSLEEIDREVVELLPDREELLLNVTGSSTGIGNNGLLNVLSVGVGIGTVAVG